MAKRSVLFVCLGNICRSPMAEAIFLDLLRKSNRLDEWIVDSAGILDIHIGKSPYSLTMKTLHAHGITQYTHRIRQVTSGDFSRFDHIFGMDEENIRDLRSIEKYTDENAKKAKLELLGSYDPKGQKNVLDPYYIDDISAFEAAFDHISRSCQRFLDQCYKSQ